MTLDPRTLSNSEAKVSAAILDGGQARRLSGVDKAWIDIGGTSIIERQLAVVRQRCEPIAMAAGDRGEVRDLRVTSLTDRVGGLGPLDGIAAALAWSPSPWVLVLACDMPFVKIEVLDLLLRSRDAISDIVVPIANGAPQPLFALYRTRLLPLLDERLAAGKLRARDLFIETLNDHAVTQIPESKIREVDPKLASFKNLNRPEDILTSKD